jgi:CSLREA domain-containing protein
MRSAVSEAVWAGKARTLAFWLVAVLAVASTWVLVEAKPAQAADFRVNSTADAGDALPGNGQCATEILPEGVRGICTLRAAIEEANANDVSDTITFSSGLSGTITLTLGRLTIANDNTTGPDLTIHGPEGSGLTVSGNNNSGVFAIAGAEATIDRLTIRDGNTTTDFGAGAGINNMIPGTLTLTNSTVSGNTSHFAGGGIYNAGTMMITNSTVSGNKVTGYDHGGGIASFGTTLTLTNSTVSDNTAHLAGGGIYRGGGTLTLTNSTVSGNTAGNFGGGIYLLGDSAKLANTIVAGNAAPSNGPDAFGAFTSQGNNLIGNASGSSGWITSGTNKDLLDTNPLLGPLQNNTPGPTETRAIWPGSPAIDHAANDRCLFSDQRGVARKDGDANGSVVCDIGAYERSDFSSPKVSSTTPAAGATGVRKGANIRATFSEKMTRSTLSKTTFKLFKVNSNGSTTQITAVAFNSSVDGLNATLDPSNLLLANTKYKAVVSTQARDLAGNQLDQSSTTSGKQQKAWTFKTGSP